MPAGGHIRTYLVGFTLPYNCLHVTQDSNGSCWGPGSPGAICCPYCHPRSACVSVPRVQETQCQGRLISGSSFLLASLLVHDTCPRREIPLSPLENNAWLIVGPPFCLINRGEGVEGRLRAAESLVFRYKLKLVAGRLLG